MSESPPQPYRSLGVISHAQFQCAADRHDLGHVTSADVLGGARGNNVGLTTERGAWVLRGVVPPLDLDSLGRERFFARAVHDRSSLKAPWPYLIDRSSDIFGWPYAIMPRLPGKVLHPGLDLNWTVVGRALGRAAADLHNVRFDRIGDWRASADDIASPDLSPADWFTRRAQHLQWRIGDTSLALDRHSAALVDDLVSAAAAAIGDVAPTFVHGDLGVGNLVGERSPAGFTFTGVFDLGGGHAGDPDEDLATPIWWPLYWRKPDAARGFFDGYCRSRPPRPGAAARLRGYVAVSLLTNWEAGRRQGFDWYGGCPTFGEWATPLLAQVDAILRQLD